MQSTTVKRKEKKTDALCVPNACTTACDLLSLIACAFLRGSASDKPCWVKSHVRQDDSTVTDCEHNPRSQDLLALLNRAHCCASDCKIQANTLGTELWKPAETTALHFFPESLVAPETVTDSVITPIKKRKEDASYT